MSDVSTNAGPGHNAGFDASYQELQGDLDKLARMKRGVTEANGELRAAINTILDDRGYHKRALGVIREIDAMSETKMADFLRTFEPMFEAMMEGKWRQEVEADLLGREGGEGDADSDPDEGEGEGDEE